MYPRHSSASHSLPATPLRAIVLACAMLGTAPAWAQDAQATASAGTTADTAGASIDQVTVVGSRARNRTVFDSSVPIDRFGAREVSNALSTGDVGAALQNLSPSINFPRIESSGASDSVRGIQLRGLAPDQVLVLINGKRRHNAALLTNGGGDTSGVNPIDLDTIPLSAIDHIEVLKDSAAAQYGSDAVAGVVNVILKTGEHGGSLGLAAGRLQEGQGKLNDFKLEADAGFRLGQDGFVHVAANARQRGQSWNNFKSANPVNYSPAGNPKNASWNRDGARNGDPGIEAYNLAFNAELPHAASGATLYAFGTAGTRNTVAGNNFRRANGLATLGQLFPDGYFAENNMSAYDFQLTAGARGKAAGWHWDVSTGYGKNRARQYSNLSSNPSLGP
ncbi:MAG: TonB-dependent receptor plug domain-containing protein, partial [Janthinobacterium sp.]